MRSFALSVSALAVALAGCATFDPPPDPEIVGLEGGILKNDKAPLVVSFGRPVDPKSLTLEVVPYVVDAEGDLADEDDDPSTDLSNGLFFQRDPRFNDFGGVGTFQDDDSRYSIKLNAPLPIGPRLAVLVEPGFASKDGITINARRRLVFGYQVDLACNKPTTRFRSGLYFMLAKVRMPIATQVRLYASIDVDPATGAFVGQFTKADRDRERKCPELHCMSNEVCRTLPVEKCALPSDPAGTVDEYPDFVPNKAAPTGYSFTATGCVFDEDNGSVSFESAPVEVHVTQPDVTLRNARLSASFKEAAGVLRASGSLSADDVLIGSSASGAAAADLTARSLTADEAPPGIPNPPQN